MNWPAKILGAGAAHVSHPCERAGSHASLGSGGEKGAHVTGVFALRIGKFVVAMIGMFIVCTISWELFASHLYDCSDDNFLGFLRPGDWVHAWNGHPVMAVHQIVHDRSMSEPDSIKAGWSVARLWCLWYSFVGLSVVVSILLARMTWIPRNKETA